MPLSDMTHDEFQTYLANFEATLRRLPSPRELQRWCQRLEAECEALKQRVAALEQDCTDLRNRELLRFWEEADTP
jgi:vacuolar-type H+-ATPase subunit D/Vma8